jgi:hypothetical protein
VRRGPPEAHPPIAGRDIVATCAPSRSWTSTATIDWYSPDRFDGPGMFDALRIAIAARTTGSPRSALTRELLSSEPTGTIVAGATTNLREQIGGSRTQDHRCAWTCHFAFSI